MKQKLIIGGLCVALVLGMVACGQQAQQEPQEPSQEVHQTDPAPTSSVEPTATPMEIKQEVPQQAEENKGPAETDPVDTSGEVNGNNGVAPDNNVDPFTPVEETVYATGTVNIRSGPSTDTEKVGSLTYGQSVTRIGIGTGDYEKWSRVQLEGGEVVYIASSYLSTTKPATQSTSNSGTTTTTQPSNNTGNQGTTTPPSNNKTGDGSDRPGGTAITSKQSTSTEGEYADSSGNTALTQEEKDEIARGITGGGN